MSITFKKDDTEHNISANDLYEMLKDNYGLLATVDLLDKYIEFTPVDKVSEAIVDCMLYDNDRYSVLHLYNSKHLYINDLYKILCNLNISVKIVDNETFKKKLKKWLYDSSKSDKVNVLLNDLDKDNNLVYKTNLHITNKFTLKFLDKADFTWPDIDIEYIRKVLSNL